jgi:hypothetical protein
MRHDHGRCTQGLLRRRIHGEAQEVHELDAGVVEDPDSSRREVGAHQQLRAAELRDQEAEMMNDSFQQAANTRCFFHVESMGWGTKLMTVLRAGGVTRGQFCHTNSMIWIKKQRIPHESFQCYYNLVLEKPTFGVTFERSGVLAVPKSRITFEVICHLTTGKPAAALNKMNDNTYNSLPSYIFCFTVKRNTPICVPLTRGDALSE